MKPKRNRVALGIYRDRWGLSATVKVDGTQREKRFPPDTPLRTIRAWQDHMRVALRAAAPRRCRTNFKTDATAYLARVRRMASYLERERNIGCGSTISDLDGDTASPRTRSRGSCSDGKGRATQRPH